MSEALFTPDGDAYVPSLHTRGPWDPLAQHAGPPAALLGRAMEALPSEVPMHTARFSMEILRPVPLQPLRVSARVDSAGRRVQRLSASLHAGGTEVCRATALRIRTTMLTLPELRAPSPEVQGPDGLIPHARLGSDPAFHETGVELRFARGAFVELGAATVWIRMRLPLLPDEIPSPLQRTLAAADFGNGVSAEMDWRRHLFINPDLTLHLFREPEGEWICLDARSWLDPHGSGLAESALHDVRGRVGRSLQSLLVDNLPPPPSVPG